MKKLVSMLLIIGIIASLFTCMTVNADDAATVGPVQMLDFSVKGSSKTAIDAGIVSATNGTSDSVYPWDNDNYGGTGVCIDEINYSSKKYPQGGFKFAAADVTKTYYVKFAYMWCNTDLTSDAVGKGGQRANGSLFVNWAENSNDKRVYSDTVTWTLDTKDNLPRTMSWKTAVLAVNPSTTTKDKENKVLQICFNGIAARLAIKWVALFDNLSDAESFDPSVKGATINGEKAAIDPFNHTASVTLADDLDESGMAAFAPSDVTLDLFNSDVDTPASLGRLEYPSNTKAVAVDTSASYRDGGQYRYRELKYTVTDSYNNNITWKVRTQSKNTAFKENIGTENILDFSVEGSAETAISNGTVAKTANDWVPLGDRNPAYGGTGLEMDATTNNNKQYAQALFKFANANPTKTQYLKFAYMLSNVSMPSGRQSGIVKAAWNSANRCDSDISWTADTLPETYVWKTAVIKIAPSTNAKDIENKQIVILFNGLTCKAVIRYVALFDTLSEAQSFDPSIKTAKIDETTAVVDPYNHTVALTLENDLDAADIPSFTKDDVNFSLFNAIDFTQNGGADSARCATTKVTALSDTATEGFDLGYNYKEIKYNVSGTGTSNIVWSVRIQSKDSSYIGAKITSAGNTVTAAYATGATESGARILAIYQGDELKGVAYSTSDDEVSITGLDAGTYTAKAFYWNNFNEGYPKFDGTEAAVTVN